MAKSKAESVEEYLAELPKDRRAALATVRQVILDNLPDGYEEALRELISEVVEIGDAD